MYLDGTESNKLLYKFESEMPDLMDILIRWRCSKFWCCIDVVKMFWSIAVDLTSADLQYCIWRSNLNETDAIQILEDSDGIDVIASLARMVLLHLAKTMQQKYPLVYKVISSDTYVDDAGKSGDSEEQVIEMANQVIHCLQEGLSRVVKYSLTTRKL